MPRDPPTPSDRLTRTVLLANIHQNEDRVAREIGDHLVSNPKFPFPIRVEPETDPGLRCPHFNTMAPVLTRCLLRDLSREVFLFSCPQPRIPGSDRRKSRGARPLVEPWRRRISVCAKASSNMRRASSPAWVGTLPPRISSFNRPSNWTRKSLFFRYPLGHPVTPPC